MYEFLDRSTVTLSAPHHFLIVSARIWALSAAFQRCAFSTLAPRFDKIGLMDTLPHFHRLMSVLNTEGVWRLELGPPCRETIDDDEAVLLNLIQAAAEGGPALHRTAEALVGDTPALAVLVEAAHRVVAEVSAAGPLRDQAG